MHKNFPASVCVYLCSVVLLDDVVKLHDRFYDKEERVRMEVVKAVCAVGTDNFEAIPKIVRCLCVRNTYMSLPGSCLYSFVMTSREE